MMRKYAYGLRLLLALVLASGIFVTAVPKQMEAKETQAYTTQDLNEQLVMATLWMQTSAEFRNSAEVCIHSVAITSCSLRS